MLIHHAFPQDAAAYVSYGLSATPSEWIAAAVRSGGYGVDLFLGLSSYLITELLIREHRRNGTIDIRAFYIRRALRIWPLYFAFLALTIFVLPHLFRHESLSTAHQVGYLTFLGNWACALFGYPESSAAPLWSVSIEEQFYLFWPLLLSLAGIRRIRGLAFSLLALATVVRLGLVVGGVVHPGIWCNTFARLDAIACGALMALLLRGGTPVFGRGLRLATATAGVLIFIVICRFCAFDGPSSLISYPASALASTLILLATLRRNDARQPVMASRPLVYLGRISYGLYVFHVLAIALAGHFLGVDFTPTVMGIRFLLALAVTILLAAISYRWLEQPFLRLKDRFTYVSSRPRQV